MCHSKPSRSGKLLDDQTWEAFVRAGVPEEELLGGQPFGPVISSYSRAEAIRDGVLVNLSANPQTAAVICQAGFRLPVAMTASAFERTLGMGLLPAGQTVTGRLWDVLTVLRAAIRRLPDGADRAEFTVSVWNGLSTDQVPLWCLCGPGDNGQPVLTIMCIGED